MQTAIKGSGATTDRLYNHWRDLLIDLLAIGWMKENNKLVGNALQTLEHCTLVARSLFM